MAGRTTGYLFSQFLVGGQKIVIYLLFGLDQVLTHLGTLRTLNIIAFVLPCIVLLFCVALPQVNWKLMVGRMLEAKGPHL